MQQTTTTSDPSVDKDGNVTVVTTITLVYAPQEFLNFQTNIQNNLTLKQAEVANISSSLNLIQAAATAVTTTLSAGFLQSSQDLAPVMGAQQIKQ